MPAPVSTPCSKGVTGTNAEAGNDGGFRPVSAHTRSGLHKPYKKFGVGWSVARHPVPGGGVVYLSGFQEGGGSWVVFPLY